MTAPASTTLPEANLAVVAGEVRRAERRAKERKDRRRTTAYAPTVLLLRAAPTWTGDERVTVDGSRALVVPAATVLAVLEALSRPREPGEYLVVLTPCEDLGESVLARAVDRQVRAINRWDLVAEGFGVKRLDPRLYAEDWLAESLLDAQPAEGWRRPGPVLLYDTAMRALCAARFGGVGGDGTIDGAALLAWSRQEANVARLAALRDDERNGIAHWLEDTVGAVARVVFRLFTHGHATDAVPIGLAVAPLFDASVTGEAAIGARVRAEERYFGGHGPTIADLHAFGEAVNSQVLRWRESGRADWVAPVVARAERLLADLDAIGLAAASPVLDTGLDARLTALADAITPLLPKPAARDLETVEERLAELLDHRRREDRAGEVDAARAAVRLTRWLATDEPAPRTVAEGVRRHLRSWSWADRALAWLWNPDTSRVPRVAVLYERLSGAVRTRRAELDAAFAQRLAAWTGSSTSGGLLLIEDLLARVARPVSERKAPLIVVVDGMSAAVGHALAEEVAGSGAWTECARGWEREAALTVIPSITRYARASLLSGTVSGGGQAEEAAGFTVFWRGRKTRLFHKAALGAGAGARLHADVQAALEEPSTIVGVVLNTIDEALDHGPSGDDHIWRIRDIRYLTDLLTVARAVGRPVVLTADHGHILDRGDSELIERAEAARYRTGAPGDGEVVARGPRVPTGDAVVVPWSERIRYTPRKAGYHGGVSAAEMVVPVMVWTPSEERLVPQGWSTLDPRQHAPDWWDLPVAADEPAPRSAPRTRKPRKRADAQDTALFAAEAAPAASSARTLGRRVAESELMRSQRDAVRNAPPAEEIASLIDGLADAHGRLSVTSAAALVGKPPARMAGYVAQAARLLNVDGYPVIGVADAGRTIELDVTLLREQFVGETG